MYLKSMDLKISSHLCCIGIISVGKFQEDTKQKYLPFRGTFSRRNKKSTLDIPKNVSTFFYKKPYFSHDALLFYI